MSITLLSDKAINRIAAGEVIERPISVVKELLENAIDAGSTEIEIRFIRGGRTLISVADNGSGISKDELKLALQRHATSKIQEDNIDDIRFFGFRGEALSSIASVGMMTMTSKSAGQEMAWSIQSSDKDLKNIVINVSQRKVGTTIELRDLFCFTPNRIKFLKTESVENIACVELVKKFALCFPEITFELTINNKLIRFAGSCALNSIMDEEFLENSLKLQHVNGDIVLNGYIGLPTYNHANHSKQHCFVNRRVVKDKLLSTAMKIAYADLIPNSRHPAYILFVQCPSDRVDVNVHPTKSEVRFADAQLMQKIIINAIRSTIDSNRGKQSNHMLQKHMSTVLQRSNVKSETAQSVDLSQHNAAMLAEKSGEDVFRYPKSNSLFKTEKVSHDLNETLEVIAQVEHSNIKEMARNATQSDEIKTLCFLGNAIMQLDFTYIVSLTNDGELIITDQHAAHERVILEKMKKQILENQLSLQSLLVPEILSYDRELVDMLIENKETIKKVGIVLERHGITQISVAAVQPLLVGMELKEIIDTVIHDLQEFSEIHDVNNLVSNIYSNIACKRSITAKRKMSIEAMNALLREIEQTPFAEQCNHGRPTYIKISALDLGKLFERL